MGNRGDVCSRQLVDVPDRRCSAQPGDDLASFDVFRELRDQLRPRQARCSGQAIGRSESLANRWAVLPTPTLHRIDAFLIRWARRKFKRLRQRPRVKWTPIFGPAA
jgi:hypothetical protein